MELTEIVNKQIVGGAKYMGRLAAELFVFYGVFRVMGIDHNPSFYAVGMYGIIRTGVDGFDAIVFKQGRMYDWMMKPSIKIDSINNNVEE